MKSLVAWLLSVVDSLAARVTLVLTVGISTAVIGALYVAEFVHAGDLRRAYIEAIVTSTVDVATRLDRDPVGAAELLNGGKILGAKLAPKDWDGATVDPEVGRLLQAQLGSASLAQAARRPRQDCFTRINLDIRAAGLDSSYLPDCWYVRFRDVGGVERLLAVDRAPVQIAKSSILNPVYLLLIVTASALLSTLVARLVTTPLRRLTAAARTFSVATDPELIPERGPREVRAALATFNIMQQRVRRGFRERTRILASVTHDLQTPLTRLRLRLEQVDNEELRSRLVHDLAGTQQLVRDGLELARSSDSFEAWSLVHIDSMLSSLTEDAAEFGGNVKFLSGCGIRSRIKPNALTRCLLNLIDNAQKYAHGAELSCEHDEREVSIHVRDHGPGIPEDQLESAFEPYRRLVPAGNANVAGSGLGLTIARAQAQSFDALLVLRNHPDGGLVATVRFSRLQSA